MLEVETHPNTRHGFISKEKNVKIEVFGDRVVLWKKGKKKKASTIPINVLWFNSLPDTADIRKGDDKKYALFEIIGPEKTWRLAIKSLAEKVEILKHLKNALKYAIGHDISDVRKTKYSFSEGFGTYKGEWFKGLPHGKGIFTCKDGTRFVGTWSCLIAAGYGKITVNSISYMGGWETHFPLGPPKESDSDVTEDGQDEDFSEEDVKILLKDSSIRTYSKGDIILSQGEANDCFFRIKKGNVRLEKMIKGKMTVLTKMGPDQMFGEMSILDKNITSATVVADTHEVELYALELPFLLEILKMNDGLSKRFHKSIAKTLASRLSKPLDEMGGKSPRDLISRQSRFSGFLVLDQKTKKESEEPPEVIMAKRWIDDWNRNIHNFEEFYGSSILYRDPFVPEGIISLKKVKDHLEDLSGKNRLWEWDDIEFFRAPEGFTVRSKIVFKSNYDKSIREYCLALIILDMDTMKITRCEVYFDLTKVNSDVRYEQKFKTSVLDSPIRRRPKDLKYSQKFGLDEKQIITKEYRCTSTGMSGKLYVSQNYICFYSKVFGMKTKEVIYIPIISDIKRKQDSNTIAILSKRANLGKRDALSDLKKSSIGEYEFTFSSHIEAEEAFDFLSSTWNTNKEIVSSKDHHHETLSTTDMLLTEFAHTHEKLPVMKIKHSPNDHSIRITLPNDTETAEGYGDDVGAKIVSTYPRKTHVDSDGTIRLDNVKQGSPICDQLCIERFENKTIVALADGCNWGKKPRDAAFKASRTFCEFIKRHLGEMATIQEAGKLFLQGVLQAHKRIIEGYDENWWDCGTTTLVGGCVLETISSFKRDGSTWAFVCASVGDCKVFKISSKTGLVSDISTTRAGNASVDATDCGGRIGPFLDGGKPDFRNLDLFYDSVNEDDIVIVASDGLHDNLDPQSLGLNPSDIGLEGSSWTSEIEGLGAAKSKFMCEKISEIVFGQNVQTCSERVNLDPNIVTEKLIQYAITVTEKSKVFMETHPNQPLPSDYKLYPGKLDHTSCVSIKVKRSMFNQIESQLDNLVIRMRHPVKGVRLDAKNVRLDPDDNFLSRRSDMLQRKNTLSSLSFQGITIKNWLQANEMQYSDVADKTAQLLLNFRYIKPVGSDSWKDETFGDDTLYTFQVYEPIMTQKDWRLLLQGARIVTYEKGDYIIREGDTRKRVFHIIGGKCVTEKVISQPEESRIVVNTMGENETFGEVSFLSDKASANVRADTDVQIYVIDWTWVNILFVRHPKLAGRFYHYLASLITHRIKKQEILINTIKS